MAGAAAATAEDAPGVAPRSIRFGQSAALAGPASALGTGMRLGILAAFGEVNAAGGVHGRQLELLTYDDRYEPESAIANTRRLIDEDSVFALIGYVGTPTSIVAAPIANEAGVPYIAPFTGAAFLRDPEFSYVVNIRASYDQEAERIVDWLTGERGVERIAILYQDDSFGRAGFAGVSAALKKRGMSLNGEGVYPRNTIAVKRALLAIRERDPQAIIVVGTYEPSAVFEKWAKKLGMDPIFVNVSFVGTDALARALGSEGIGTYVSQVVPHPRYGDQTVLLRYRKALRALNPGAEPGFVSLEGYLAGRLAASVLDAAGPEPTRQGFIETLHALGRFDLGGFELNFRDGGNQGSDAVFLTMIGDRKQIVPVE
ncbi:MAG: ABC transporter substrate-binding protein [Alphaproteobacteria bacterium]